MGDKCWLEGWGGGERGSISGVGWAEDEKRTQSNRDLLLGVSVDDSPSQLTLIFLILYLSVGKFHEQCQSPKSEKKHGVKIHCGGENVKFSAKLSDLKC